MKQNIKRFALTILVYGIVIVLATVIFIGMFHTSLLKGITVFFYRGCVLLILASVCAVLILLIIKRLFPALGLDIKDAFVIFFLFSGFTLGWFVLAPVTVERSISVYMLSYMDQNSEEGITSDEFSDVFYEKYITNYGAFEKRFDEQLYSGNIKMAEDGHGYVITDSGRNIVNGFRICADLFGTEKWLVYPNDYEMGYKHDAE